jgi:hypothetical protein
MSRAIAKAPDFPEIREDLDLLCDQLGRRFGA